MKYKQYFDRKLKKKCWRIDMTVCGQRIRRGGFPNKAFAERAVLSIRTKVEEHRYGLQGEAPGHTVLDLLEAREADPMAARQRQALQSLRWFVDFVGDYQLLAKITTSTIKAFVNHLQSEEEKPRKQSSIKAYLNHIHAALNSAQNYFDSCEWTPPRFPRIKIEPGRNRVLTAAELERLLAALHADRLRFEAEKGIQFRLAAADLIRLALLIPGRQGELLALKITDLNLDWMLVQIYSPKTQTTRSIPLSLMALQILERHWPSKGTRFFSMVPKQMITAMRKAADLAQVPYGDNILGGFVYHDLRHTAATIMSNSGIDHATIAYLLGHSAAGMTSRYIHPPVEILRKGIEAIETYCRRIDGFVREEGQAEVLERSMTR